MSHYFTLDPRRAYPTLVRGEGVHVWDADGRRLLDAIAGIGVVNVGYGRDQVADSMAEQARRLPFAVGNIFANEPAERLAEAVASVTPGDLDYVHLTSGGSEAMEVALKIARQYHVERGHSERSVMVSRWTSYHGATLATLSVGGAIGRRRKFEPLLIDTPHVKPAYCYRCPWSQSYPGCGRECISEVEAAFEQIGPERIAAFIVEPITASVGGAIAPPPEYFPAVRALCDRHGVLLIADEIVTGFGRTGRAFALDHWGVVPDIMAMGKGISGGYAPLGAVAVRRHVRAAFEEAGSPFDHVFTFGGHPVSAAAGLAVLAIWKREGLTERVASLGPMFAAALDGLRDVDIVGDVRSTGYMAGVEFVANLATREAFPPELGVAARVREAGLRRGIVLYPGTGMAPGARGDIVSLYPPLTFSQDDIAEAARLTRLAIADVAHDLAEDR